VDGVARSPDKVRLFLRSLPRGGGHGREPGNPCP
jgi:hypothetical protein